MDCPSGGISGGAGLTDDFFSSYSELGRGACHVFYKARRWGRWYVLKGLAEQFRGNPIYEEWLYKEYSIGVRLDHPNVVRVESFEHDEKAGQCIVMEYVAGTTLDEWLKGKRSCGERREVLGQLLDAVTHCHAHNVYHHDLKPANIIITEEVNNVKLIDFGLSDGPQYAAFKQSSGTVGYAAPEQGEGMVSDQRADIYSLGRITSMMFPHRYRRAVRKATRKEPTRRPATVERFRREMRSLWYVWVGVAMAIVALVIAAVVPTNRMFRVRLDSGQMVYYRVISNFPQREVMLVCPASATQPWPEEYEEIGGEMRIPATIKRFGLDYRVTSIDDGTFQNCFGLKRVELPEGLESIGRMAFCACSGLRDTLVIPRSLTRLGLSAFNDCSRLTTVVWKADSCEYSFKSDIRTFFYRCSSLEKVVVTGNVRHVPLDLFRSVVNLREAVFEDGLETMPNNMFARDSNMTDIVFPNSLKVIEHGAFYATGFESLKFPDSTEVVGNYAFSYDYNIRNIDFGRSIKFVGNYAFTECYNLECVTVRALEPPSVLETTFEGRPSNAVLKVPKESVEKYRHHAVWGQWENIEAIE